VILQWEVNVVTDISIPQIVNLVSKKEVKLYFFDRLNVGVSSGIKIDQLCTAFTVNRNLHAVCSTHLFGLRPFNNFLLLFK
jgi:hypothetical protein